MVLPTLDLQFITSSGKHFIHFGLCTLYARLLHYLFQSVICPCTNEKSTGGKMHPAFVLGLLLGCGGQLLAFFSLSLVLVPVRGLYNKLTRPSVPLMSKLANIIDHNISTLCAAGLNF